MHPERGAGTRSSKTRRRKLLAPMKIMVRVGAERVPLMERQIEHVDERQDAEDSRGSRASARAAASPPCSIAFDQSPWARPDSTGRRPSQTRAVRRAGGSDRDRRLLAVAEVGQFGLGGGGHLVEAVVRVDARRSGSCRRSGAVASRTWAWNG